MSTKQETGKLRPLELEPLETGEMRRHLFKLAGLIGIGLLANKGAKGVSYLAQWLTQLNYRLTSIASAQGKMNRRQFFLAIVFKNLLLSEWQPGDPIPESFTGKLVKIVNNRPSGDIRLAPHPLLGGINKLDELARLFKPEWKFEIVTIRSKEDVPTDIEGNTVGWFERTNAITENIPPPGQERPLYEILPVYNRDQKCGTLYILPGESFAPLGKAIPPGGPSDQVGSIRLTTEIITYLAGNVEHYQNHSELDFPEGTAQQIAMLNGWSGDGGLPTALIYCDIPGSILH